MSVTILLDFPERMFRMFAYMTSHSQLLLRSTKAPPAESQIDVLFHGVEWVGIPIFMSGLQVSLSAKLPLALVGDVPAALLAENRAFMLRGDLYEGFVIAHSLDVDEGDREYHEPDKWGVYPGLESGYKFAD